MTRRDKFWGRSPEPEFGLLGWLGLRSSRFRWCGRRGWNCCREIDVMGDGKDGIEKNLVKSSLGGSRCVGFD